MSAPRARHALADGDVVAAIVVPHGFVTQLLAR